MDHVCFISNIVVYCVTSCVCGLKYKKVNNDVLCCLYFALLLMYVTGCVEGVSLFHFSHLLFCFLCLEWVDTLKKNP